MEYSERMRKLIEVIRKRPEWVSSHGEIEFSKGTIGYYDAGKGQNFFQLKLEGFVVNHYQDGGCTITVPLVNNFDKFSLDGWLKELEAIVVEENTLVMGGKKYLLQEVKE